MHRYKNYFLLIALTLVFAAICTPFIAEWAKAQETPSQSTVNGQSGAEDQVLINPNLPTVPGLEGGTDPASLVANIYRIAIWLGAFLAFAAIVYGGFMWAMPMGSGERAGEGKTYVTNAVLGLVMLFAIYILLNIVNPDLTNLRFPALKRLRPPVGITFSDGQLVWGCKGNGRNDKLDVKACFPNKEVCEEVCEEQYDEPEPGVPDVYECVEMLGGECRAQSPAGQGTGSYGAVGVAVPGGLLSDSAARSLLASHNAQSPYKVTVNKPNCTLPAGQTSCSAAYPQCTSCTSLDGVSNIIISSLIAIANECKCSMRVTGGTEAGHKTHGMGKGLLDLGSMAPADNGLNDYIKVKLGVVSDAQVAAKQSANKWPPGFTPYSGTRIPGVSWLMYENTPESRKHWHVQF